jgi:hypothetical protein
MSELAWQGAERGSRQRAVRRRITLVVGALCTLLVLCQPTPAFAAMMHHYDLTSLAFEADIIVRARTVAETKKDQWTTVRTMVVTRKYKGDLEAGASFKVAYDLYSTSNYFDTFGEAPDAGPKPVLGDEVVLFLSREADKFNPPPGDFWVVSSGLRIFLDGKAQRFEQWNNPGGFVPVPQGRDPYDLYGDPRGKDALDLAGLESEIFRAMRQATEAKAAVDAPDTPARRRALLAMCGPESSEARPANSAFGGFYANLVSEKIVEALAKTGDVKATLEGMARCEDVDAFRLSADLSLASVFDAAADTKLSVPLRVAALSYLAHGNVIRLRDMTTADAKVIALLGDHSPEVRIAALRVHPTDTTTPAMKAAILARWKAEKDDRVRLALIRGADTHGMLADLAAIATQLPVLSANRTHDVVTIRWADVDDLFNLNVTSATVVARRAGERDRTLDVVKNAALSSNGREGFKSARLAFDPPFSPSGGQVKIDMSVVLEDSNKHRPTVRRSFDLGMMTIDPPLPPLVPAPPAPSAPPSPPRSASSSASANPAPSPGRSATPTPPITTAPKRSSCGCDLVPARPTEATWLTLGAWALLVARRRAGAGHSTWPPRCPKRDNALRTSSTFSARG